MDIQSLSQNIPARALILRYSSFEGGIVFPSVKHECKVRATALHILVVPPATAGDTGPTVPYKIEH